MQTVVLYGGYGAAKILPQLVILRRARLPPALFGGCAEESRSYKEAFVVTGKAVEPSSYEIPATAKLEVHLSRHPHLPGYCTPESRCG